MSRMEALKLPRSSLTETMRSLGATQGARPSEARTPPHRLPDDGRPSASSIDYYTKYPAKGELPQLWQQWRAPVVKPIPTAGMASKEIQAILASGHPDSAATHISATRAISSHSSNHTTSPIFGCSPPSRALNPLSQDSKFKTPSRPIGGLSAAFASSDSI